MGQLGFYFDSTVCTGCKTCQVACQDKNDLSAALLFRRVFYYGGGGWDKQEGYYTPNGVFRYFISEGCNHCMAPACIATCPVSAIIKDEENGVVWIDTEVCIGCKTCLTACPYAVPVFDEASGIARKCDFCRDLLAEGKEPACINGCNQRALKFGEYDELSTQHPDAMADIEPLPVPSTGPSLLISPHKDAQKSGQGTGEVLNMPEEL
jgi:anaerobic dimethyl sulfoxide reductase subunit B (iron-sulfur subunit)